MGNLTSVDQVHGDEALVELCDESLSANMATTQMKILKHHHPPICQYIYIYANRRNTELYASIYELWFYVLLELNNNCIFGR